MRFSHLRRREFVALLSGTAAWPLAARGQQPERMRRIGVLTNIAENDPESKARNAAFQQGLQQLGWIDGRNVRIDTRWTLGDAERTRKYAAELVALSPDVILAIGTEVMASLQQATRTVRSFSCWSPIRSARVSSIASRALAATPPALPLPNMASVANGWNCSKRSHPA
jgi:ABC-type uncharacterized transport system substrate-binding protein